MAFESLGRFGVWRAYTGFSPEDARELEQLGYGALWLGASPPADLAVVEPLLEATETITVATSIVNIWAAPAKEVADSFQRIEARFPGRFLLGIGAGHPEHTGEYRKPYDALVEYLDELDAAGVPAERRAVAALGPRVLKLAAERSAGALPYFVPSAHTAKAREITGPDALLATEHMVVLTDDARAAHAVADGTAGFYLGLTNYVSNLRRFGFTDADLTTPPSDRLFDAIIAHGTPEHIVARLSEHLDAGADHVAVQILGDNYLAALRTLAPLLTARS
ncbi:LLM class F420-dependent oxidoreductase [Nocardia sp. NBC_00508]|uniref:LLM class F420-dependent oxidoreductase n=1 Tax=Nocardia sp. NBC_00508 TaxID=2975992 RepID=UPI002E80CB08|nr:LLM class F420-dependent oxidoreductase [Nocardia sp. NBC_00508]WUD68624.1 LLM class F420-dependent oxidoreductase [Nocardia sp. NBC_00508]